MTPADRIKRDAADFERGIRNVTYHSAWLGLVCTVRFTWAEQEHYQHATISAGVEELLTVEIDGVDLWPHLTELACDKVCDEIKMMHNPRRK